MATIIGAIAIAGAVGAVVAVVGVPLTLRVVLGFGKAGIVAGTFAASMMARLAPTVVGGIVATFQSIGAIGLSAASTVGVGIAGALATAAAVAVFII